MSQQEQARGLHTYAYKYNPAREGFPTFLFLHSFPSICEIWDKVADRLSRRGYGTLSPDLLGYGDSEKPEDMREYSLRKMSSALVEMLVHHQLESVIGVGHGLGAALLTRLWWYKPQYLAGLAFMGAEYTLPTASNYDSIIRKSQRYGMDIGGYWSFLISDEAPQLLNANLTKIPSTMSIFYSSDPVLWSDFLLSSGGLQDWLVHNRYSPSSVFSAQSGTDEHIKQSISTAFAQGHFGAPLNWHKSIRYQIDRESELSLPENLWIINRPVLFLVGEHDAMGYPGIVLENCEESNRAGYLPDVECTVVNNASHWMMIEQPELVVNALILLSRRVRINRARRIVQTASTVLQRIILYSPPLLLSAALCLFFFSTTTALKHATMAIPFSFPWTISELCVGRVLRGCVGVRLWHLRGCLRE
ncbi:alpha/beta-hydrolase [Karstenula rhodostoma CBS 690.94]|uniref:Alpha/beta-hydrolase n=1 Tax=Karstenula rhodostoma CBS 690.94 TaxID=1392251 RepID=A0A9P4UJ81_9PLEO|nr:alpha/beta-hydrolase [Karstenula rhodostoma CBS 690.94]